ncbi:hypothetical protein [Photobacterium profundum]|uniref:hypothetical protein n=1 Tax=Photobacterium profundum TaxID=74109 RepID=UPI0003252510|nr:hypothetical protein [Photobacterium profundum]
MKIKQKLLTVNKRLFGFFTIIKQLFPFFRQEVDIQVLRVCLMMFGGKFLNMVVMFIPLKLLFVLSGSKNIHFLEQIELKLGRTTYIGLMIALVTVLYLFNTALQIYKGKLLNKQKQRITHKNYEFNGKSLPYKTILRTYAAYCQIIADAFLAILITGLMFLLNVQYALYFAAVTGVYFIFIEYWAFSNYETRLLNKLSIDKKQFINAFSSIFYLVMFIGIIFVVLSTNIHILVAILMLLLVRLANGALKTFFSSQLTIRHHYLF